MTQSCDRLFEQLSREITEACFVNSINSSEVIRKMSEYDNKKKDSSLFVVTRHYTRMVMMMLSFIKAVPTGDWQLHLLSLELFIKYFFADDKINYARMIPAYLAEISALKTTNPTIH